jgi:Phosphotransferase enzyme family
MQTDLLEHPAVKAWINLQPDCVEPESVEILDRKTRAWIKLQSERAEPESIEILDSKARAWIRFRSERIRPEITEILKEEKFIYRLNGVGSEGSTIIAKQCEEGDGMLEHTIYKEILSRLPVTTLRCYGFVEEPSGKFGWLFVEDAGTEVFRFHIRQHSALAARWLGLMHTSAMNVAARACLPDRGPDYYLEHLQLARDKIQRAIVNSPLGPDDMVVLESIVSQCNVLESCWSKVETFCDKMPQTLVHSDFRQSNTRVRNCRTGVALMLFDWEMAGWGIPAADLQNLEQADLAIYWSVVRRTWPYVGIQDIQQMANFGRVFRALANINWQSWAFEYNWDSWPSQDRLLKDEQIKLAVIDMKIDEASIADAILAATWED